MIVRALAKLLVVLNSNRRAVEIGAAIALGLWLALVPSANLIFAALVVVVFLVKVNLGMAIVSFLLFSLLVPLLDPALDAFGYYLLTRPGLQEFYAAIYAAPLVRLTFFNDTLVAGGFVAGGLLAAPVTWLGVLLVRVYRKHIHARIANSKPVKAIIATSLVQKILRAVRQVQRVWPAAG